MQQDGQLARGRARPENQIAQPVVPVRLPQGQSVRSGFPVGGHTNAIFLVGKDVVPGR